MKKSETKLFEDAKYWHTKYKSTGRRSDLLNGLIAIKDACNLNPWNSQYSDLNRVLEDELYNISR